MKIFPFILFFCPLILCAEVLRIDGVDFHYRIPRDHGTDSKIMVLFGGRNWPGDKTLKTYAFDDLADKHRLFLLSPSFRDRDYWNPELWSGRLLKKAVARLEKHYRLGSPRIFLYGYSAGGQCAALFYQWMPERIAAWGVHACGVYPEEIKSFQAPALITCGTEDRERFQISRQFVYRYREPGGRLLWKYFPDAGHELSFRALEIAKVWFDDLLSGKKALLSGEDDTRRIGGEIDADFRNPLYSEKLKDLWLK